MARKYQLHGAFPSKAGDSAYEVAQKNGFEGTEEEWLASLVGPRGSQGPQGPAGKDADPNKIIFDIILEESVSEFIYPLSEDDIKKLLNSSILSFHTSLRPDSNNTENAAGPIKFGLYPLAGHYYNEFKLMEGVPAIAPSGWGGPMFMTFTAFGLMWIGDGQSKVGARYPTITGFHSGTFQAQLGLTQPDYSKLEVGYGFKITAISSELGAGSRMILSV